MKNLRVFLGLWLSLAIAACSFAPNIPDLPFGNTATPSTTPTPAPTFTPTITPTPLPVARVAKGDQALFNGDYESALSLYKTSFSDSPDPMVRAAAKWGEARVYFADERYEECITAIQVIAREYPQLPQLGQAYFVQGLALYRLGNYQAAADSWQTYLVLRPGYLDSYAQELRGDALYQAGNYTEALPAYKVAITSPALGDDIQLDLKVAGTYAELGNYDDALALYEGVGARTANDYVKAQAAYEAALAFRLAGKQEDALGKFRLNVTEYPLSYYSYLSLIELIDAGEQVNDLDRGLVDYFAGQYAVGIAAFDRYIASNPNNDGTAHYFRALSYRDLGNYNAAVEGLTYFINTYPSHSRWGDAWGEKAFMQWYNMGAYSVGAQTLIDFVQGSPTNTLSPDYLFSAGRIYERDGNEDKALETWARLANEYPGSEQAANATFLMGILYYREGDTLSARDSFQRSLTLSVSANDKARAHLWMGKCDKKLGDAKSAENEWRAAQELDAGGYYSERARDLLLDRAQFESPLALNLNPDIESKRKDAEAWMRLTFNLAPETDLSGLGEMASDLRIKRGTELWELGLYDDARLEFEDLRKELETNQDAVDSYRLMNYLVDMGLYRSAIFAARQTLTLAGLDEHTESMMAPTYFGYVRYGLYYPDLVVPDAKLNDLDPLFVYSVIRQESLFEGFVKSSAGARGLMQVIPSTGGQIVTQLGWPLNYDDNDLYRPDVSVAFGTHYLARNKAYLDGDLYATLAAYNGGPGNAAEWQRLAGNDPDLYLESVRFEETRNYIRNIYEIYIIYRRLYGVE